MKCGEEEKVEVAIGGMEECGTIGCGIRECGEVSFVEEDVEFEGVLSSSLRRVRRLRIGRVR